MGIFGCGMKQADVVVETEQPLAFQRCGPLWCATFVSDGKQLLAQVMETESYVRELLGSSKRKARMTTVHRWLEWQCITFT